MRVLDSAMDNLDAWRIGKACLAAKPGGDLIDHGLSLMHELKAQGFGIVRLSASTPVVSEKGVTFAPEDVAVLRKVLSKYDRGADEDGGWIDDWFSREEGERINAIANKINALLPPSDSPRTTT